jgi:parallel beta-helix repeat protein
VHRTRLATILTASLFSLALLLAGPWAATTSAQTTVSGSIQAAVDAARPGDTLVLNATTYAEEVQIEVSGTAQAPITLKGAGMDASIIRGAVSVSGSHIVIEDLTVDVGGADSDGVDINPPAQNITLRRVHLQNGRGYGVRVGDDVAGVLIEGCVINNFDAGSSDAHGIGVKTARDITIRGCDIYGNSGDAIQLNTPDYPGYNRWAQNIRIEGNRLHDNRENALDIKSADGVVFHGNLAWGYRSVDTSDGMAIQVQYGARNVVITANQIWDSGQGIEVTRGVKSGTDYPIFPENILIAGNLIRGIIDDGSGDSGAGSGIIVRSSSNVRLYNNTVVDVVGAGLYVGVSGDTLPSGLDVRNNVFGGGANDVRLSSPEAAAGLVVDYNHYVSGQVNEEPLSEWLAAGFERHATSGNPGLDGGWLPAGGSPLIDSGTAVGLAFKGAAPDRGWGEMEGAPAVEIPVPTPGPNPNPTPSPTPNPPRPRPASYEYSIYLPALRNR